MTRSLGGPAIVMGVVLAEVAIGTATVLWLTPLWGRVRMSFWRLMGVILATTGVLAFAAARGPLLHGDEPRAASISMIALGVFCVLTVAWALVSWTRLDARARLLGLASIPAGVVALVALAADPASARALPVSAFQLLAGAVFAGAATAGLLLGHWYLVDRGLSREPLRRLNHAFLVACAAALVGALFAIGSGSGQAQEQLSPLLGAGALAAYLAVGLVALCAMIGGFIRALIKENSIQAATGLFYLAVIMALSAEFAAKVRFF